MFLSDSVFLGMRVSRIDNYFWDDCLSYLKHKAFSELFRVTAFISGRAKINPSTAQLRR